MSVPSFLVEKIRSLGEVSEPIARALTSVSLRIAAFTLLGILMSAALGRFSARVALPLGMILAPVLAVLSQWINFGYFPIAIQLKVSMLSAMTGALLGFAFRRGRFAPGLLVAIVVAVAVTFFWGTRTTVPHDIDVATQQTVQYILAQADKIRSGNEGFADAVHLAFSLAEDNSHQEDPVHANKAAVLALGIILGDETVAQVARTQFEPEWRAQIESLRQLITLRNRSDSPRHFWVSAALTVITNESQAMTVGLGKELLDANPGGSGFSFADLAANRAGILFALAAIRDPASAKATQILIVEDGLQADDYCPEIKDLPEGLTRDQFQTTYGGMGGELTKILRREIDQRMTTKAVLRFSK